jgi:transcriptional regulator with XRE-family HTH domain
MSEFAAALRALLAERDISQRALARGVPCDPALISRYASGAQEPSPRMAARVDEALGAGGELAALAPVHALWHAPGSLTPDDEERLALAADAPSRVDAQVLDSLAGILAGQRVLDDRIGSEPLLTAARAQYDVTERLARAAPAALRSRALDITAQYGYFRGWLHESTGRLAAAERLYDAALGQAAETGNADLTSELISMKGHLAWMRGEPGEVVRLSQAAQRDPAAFPGQHAISAMQEARAHAVLGDARAVSRKLADADRASALAQERPEDQPPWLYYHSPGFFTVQRGRAWLHLGARDRRYSRMAVEALTAGVDALDDTARQSEWGASYLLHLARAHMQQDDAEQACAAAAQAASVARRLASGRLRALLRELHGQMAARWPGHPDVAALAEALP